MDLKTSAVLQCKKGSKMKFLVIFIVAIWGCVLFNSVAANDEVTTDKLRA